jgi:UDP-2,3-diacylglucosamine pyrophosphatase LpxH
MPETRHTALPPGLVLWPSGTVTQNRLCVLLSDIHCTDCTVGNQTASETDWQLFFEQMEFAVRNPGNKAETAREQSIDELILVLNGDIIDLVRTGKWAQAGVYPWQRDDPRFPAIVVEIMRDIVRIHAHARVPHSPHPYSGFFYWMRRSLERLRDQQVKVSIVPIVGNHDKELQVVPEARQMFYEECLGLTALDIGGAYRRWVSTQLGMTDDHRYPLLPFYFADTGLRLLATHGQWRDQDNARATRLWHAGKGWTPEQWQKEHYLPFIEPCFGDTVAAGMLSHFIWRTAQRIDRSLPGAERICHLLDEMDLYRPSVEAVVRLLRESKRAARRDARAKDLHETVLGCFRASLRGWLAHETTWRSAWGTTRVGLIFLKCMSRFRSYWIDVLVMRLMAKAQEPEADIAMRRLRTLPAFSAAYRALGLRLHVEGHTHVALEADLQFRTPRSGRNYTYINLGAWRDKIVPKRNRGFRRRGIGRALFVFDLARLPEEQRQDAYRFYARDVTSWGDRMDYW